MEEGAWSTYVEPSRLPVVSPKDDQEQHEVIRSDLKERKASKDIAKDRNTSKSFIRNRQPVQTWKTR